MTNKTMYLAILVLAIVFVVLFKRTGSSKSLTDQKRADVERRRAALRAKRKAQAKSQSDNENQ